ncbi:MAG TPA: M15 family metallopeptidase [Tissierellia bacterium]|nr:M15 family metallopeptidase [Tissierellia bacterium]
MKKRSFIFAILLCVFISIFIFRPRSESSPVINNPSPDTFGDSITTPSEDESNIPSESNADEEVEEEEKEVDLLEETSHIDDDGKVIVDNTDDILVLVNKNRNLPSDYVPDDLVVPNVRFTFEGFDEKKQMRKEAAEALEELFKAAEEEGIYLFAVSGYRSYNRQKYLFDTRAARDGFEEANKLTAYPGQSEHQTGLAMDVSCQSVGFDLTQKFGQTVEGIWLKENAHKFGFIIRYQEDKVDITGYSYEPWHIRYVGKEAAKEIYERNITLEEYLGA